MIDARVFAGEMEFIPIIQELPLAEMRVCQRWTDIHDGRLSSNYTALAPKSKDPCVIPRHATRYRNLEYNLCFHCGGIPACGPSGCS